MFTSRRGRLSEARLKKGLEKSKPPKTHPVWVELNPKGHDRAALWLALLSSTLGSASVPGRLLLELKCNKRNW